jgi:phage-related protein
MTGSMVKLTKSMDGARDGSKKQAAAFETLGVKVKDSNGNLRDSKQVWLETIDALGAVGNETERDALALELFGKSAQDLNPLIKAGSAELSRLGQEANDLGVVMGDDAVKAAGAFDDSMQKLDASVQGIGRNIGVAVMPGIQAAVTAAASVTPQVIQAIQTGDWAGAGTAVTGAINGILQQAAAALPGLMTLGATIIGELVNTISASIPAVLPAVIAAVLLLLTTLVQTVTENGPMLIQTGIDAIMTLVNGLVEALPQLVDMAIVLVLALVDGLLAALPQLVEAAIKLVVTLAEGLIKALPELIKQAPKIIKAIVETLLKNMPLLIDGAITLIVELAKALISNLPLIASAAVEIMVGLVKGFVGAIPQMLAAIPKLFGEMGKAVMSVNWGELGGNMIKGIGEGIKNTAKSLAEGVKNAAQKALEGAKNFLGIRSPSRVMRDEVGKMIGAGMAEGITSSTRKVQSAMGGLTEQLTEAGPAGVRGGLSVAGAAPGSPTVVVNVPVNLDSRPITAATSRVQLGQNRTRSRALGVVPA